MNKKYELIIKIRNGMQERDFGVYELDLIHWEETFKVSDLSVFKDNSYIVFSLREVETKDEDKESNE